MLKTYEMLKQDLTAYKAPDMKMKRMADRREVIKLKKNLYKTGPTVSGYLEAAAICTPSYLSFDYALSCHGLIPERAKIYTSATCRKRKKKTFRNWFGNIYIYIYIRIFRCLFFHSKLKYATKMKDLFDGHARKSYMRQALHSQAHTFQKASAAAAF